MDHMRFSISIVARNALRDKYNKNCVRSVGQRERKIDWNHIRLTSVISHTIKIFKIGQWDARVKMNTRFLAQGPTS